MNQNLDIICVYCGKKKKIKKYDIRLNNVFICSKDYKKGRSYSETIMTVIGSLIFFGLLLGLKAANQKVFSNEDFLKLAKDYFPNSTNTAWFTNELSFSNFWNGPLGLGIFFNFNIFKTEQILPPLILDFVANWLFVVSILGSIVAIIISVVYETRTRKTMAFYKDIQDKEKARMQLEVKIKTQIAEQTKKEKVIASKAKAEVKRQLNSLSKLNANNDKKDKNNTNN